jgi:ribosomal protein L12E/L44/L45/RPP1/RPP2
MRCKAELCITPSVFNNLAKKTAAISTTVGYSAKGFLFSIYAEPHMKVVKIALLTVAAQAFMFQAHAQQADVSAMYASAQAEGKTAGEFVAQMTDLKTCNPQLAEKVVEFALEQAGNDPVKAEEVLRSVNTACVDQDTVTTLAIAANLDPALISNALQTATAAGPAAGAPAVAAALAPAPGGVGAGGGTGTGDSALASGS